MNILLVDDHPLIIDAYEIIIRSKENFENVTIDKAYNCREAYHSIIDKKNNNHEFDLAIVDVNLPPCPEHSINSGIDIIKLLKSNFNSCKVLVITAHDETLLVYDIIKSVKPNGIAIKNDITVDSLPLIISALESGNIYKSKTVLKKIEHLWQKKLLMDDYNRNIISLLSKGYKAQELHNFIPLSESTIRKRIINLKKAFKINKEAGLVLVAKNEGFV